jgi:hypothetical protein
MTVYDELNKEVRFGQPPSPARLRRLILFLMCAAILGVAAPRVTTAKVALVVVDVVAVADGYRASQLRGTKVVNSQNDTIGKLDDLIVGRDRVLFAIIQVGGFLGLGSHLIAVPYTSLRISDDGKRIVLPGATKEQLENLPEFKYR